jgi:hypothetical protein
VLRLLEVELVVGLLEKPGFSRLGMMRTMAGAGSTAGYYGIPVRPACSSFQVSRLVAVQVPGGLLGMAGSRLACRAFAFGGVLWVCSPGAAPPAAPQLAASGQQRFASNRRSNPSPHNRQNRRRLGFLRNVRHWAAVLEPRRRGRHPAAAETRRWVYTPVSSVSSSVQRWKSSGNGSQGSGAEDKDRGGCWLGLGLEPHQEGKYDVFTRRQAQAGQCQLGGSRWQLIKRTPDKVIEAPVLALEVL